MHQRTGRSIRSATITGIAASALLGLAGMTLTPAPADAAVVYCTYVGYPTGCVARAGVVLRPRPVARAAVTKLACGSRALARSQPRDPEAFSGSSSAWRS